MGEAREAGASSLGAGPEGPGSEGRGTRGGGLAGRGSLGGLRPKGKSGAGVMRGHKRLTGT